MIRKYLILILLWSSMAFGQAFDPDSAFHFLTKQVDFGPRNPGSTGHDKCADYLAQQMKKYAGNVEIQKFAVSGYGEQLRLKNIISRFNPGVRDRLLLCAHWDTRPRADYAERNKDLPIAGANDGASGVAVLLEIARQLSISEPGYGIDIVLFDGEDYGLEGDLDLYFLGAKNFVKVNEIGQYREGILLDMIGDKELTIYREYYSQKYAPELADKLWNIAWDLGMMGFQTNVNYAIQDDHLILNKAGIPTVDIIDFEYPDKQNSYWHTHRDVPENCSPESLNEVGTVVMNYIYQR